MHTQTIIDVNCYVNRFWSPVVYALSQSRVRTTGSQQYVRLRQEHLQLKIDFHSNTPAISLVVFSVYNISSPSRVRNRINTRRVLRYHGLCPFDVSDREFVQTISFVNCGLIVFVFTAIMNIKPPTRLIPSHSDCPLCPTCRVRAFHESQRWHRKRHIG